jgi:signal transduction histidine kinase/CheY-like chemotaxis protein
VDPARPCALPDFRVLFESAPGSYLVLSPDFTIVAVSDAYLRATMTERAAIVGRGLFEVFPDNPADPAATGVSNLRASLARVLDLRRPDAMAVQKYDIRRPEAEGGGFEERYWSPVNSPVLGLGGRVAYIIHRVEDVTEFVRLKEAETQQHRLAEELKSRTGAMETEIYRRAQEIQEANAQLRALQADLEQRVQTRTADLQRANDELQREMAERHRTEDALRRSEAQLRQAQKMEAVGRLAGGVAHDFNNLLTAIMGYSQLLRSRPGVGKDALQDIAEVEKAAARAASLTRQLLAFSRQQRLLPRVLDLNQVIVETDKMLRRLIGEDIDLLTVAAPDLGHVKTDPGQIEQVLLNLAVNARDAMPEGGKLTIETANVTLDEAAIHGREGLSPGAYVMLAVSDNGVGMDAETKARIFEPFFTTKEIGRGTGLGLSTVHGIIKQSGGHVEAYSEPGHGATFKVYLPRVDAPLDVPAPIPASSTGLNGSETILVVEDEDLVRRVVCEGLRLRGYRVIEARDRTEALATCDDCQRRRIALDLMVSDVVMPGLSIAELLDRLRVGYPSLRILYMSGYTDRAMSHQGVVPTGAAYLQKPFTLDALVRKVREVLDEPLRRAA